MFFNRKNKTRISIHVKPSKKVPESFFDLPSKEQRKIIDKATREANEEQLDVHEKASRACI